MAESEVFSMLLGSLVNAAAILAGSAVGLLLRFFLRRSSRRSAGANGIGDRLQKTVMQGLALCTMYIGVSGALKGQNTLIAILSVVIGAVIGELLDLDRAMNRAGEWVQNRLTRPGSENANSTVAEGFVTASLLYVVGAMAIVGSLNSGLFGDHSMLFAKSLLDGISSVVFSVSFGIGVPLSAAAVFCLSGDHHACRQQSCAPSQRRGRCRNDLCRLAADRCHQPEYAGGYQNQGDELCSGHISADSSLPVSVKAALAQRHEAFPVSVLPAARRQGDS